MNEPLILLLQRLQNTLVPLILAGSGCILIIASVIGIFWKREITPKRRKAAGCFGAFFLFSSIFLYGGPLLLRTYAPMITIGQIIAFLIQNLVLFLQGLQNTPIPPILAGTGCIIIIISIAGIFGGRNISRKQQIWAASFGIFLLIFGIFSYTGPLLLIRNQATGNAKETMKIFFRDGNKNITSKLSYKGILTITITGEAKSSGVGFSDAFYFYDHSTSHPIHRTNYTIWINDKPVDAFVKIIPLYRKDHTYTFEINAPGGYLVFDVGIGLAIDKTDFFTISLF